MAQGISLHIGLNNIDESVYGPGNELFGCHNDATAMQSLAVNQGFQTTLMLDEQATATTVIQAISGATGSLMAGDIMFLTYSGHGSQIPDKNGDEPDGQDETWCLYDRMLLDDELNQLWSQFAGGVRIVMLSDSCHSGTVLRQIMSREHALAPELEERFRGLHRLPTARAALARSAAGPPPATGAGARPPAVAPQSSDVVYRWLPPDAAEQAYNADKGLYDTVQLVAGPKSKATIAASVILISGCQDNQLSADGDVNGRFTEKLLNVWNSGTFSGDYRAFHRQILEQMPPDQTPNFVTEGAVNAVFEQQRPFTVTTDATNEPVPASLWVRGPASLARTDPAPSFEVNPGPNAYYIFEITSDASLLDTGVNAHLRTDDNFYGSWSDSAHLQGTSYTLPDPVWTRLNPADTLSYRIGSTATSTGWSNYMVSTPDQQYANAPAITLAGSASDTSGGTSDGSGSSATPGLPSIWGPSSADAAGAAPSFTIDTAGAPYFIVEVATDPAWLDDASGQTEATFYGSWSDTELLTGDSYTLPDYVWWRLDLSGGTFSYRVGTTTGTNWENYQVSDAAAIEIVGSRALAGVM